MTQAWAFHSNFRSPGNSLIQMGSWQPVYCHISGVGFPCLTAGSIEDKLLLVHLFNSCHPLQFCIMYNCMAPCLVKFRYFILCLKWRLYYDPRLLCYNCGIQVPNPHIIICWCFTVQSRDCTGLVQVLHTGPGKSQMCHKACLHLLKRKPHWCT